MTVQALLALLSDSPLVASVQASDPSPLAQPEKLLPLAQASQQEGVRLLRLEGADAIRLIRAECGLPAIGLIKRHYEGSEVYITPTATEVAELVDLGCEVIALDGTQRWRWAEDFEALLAQIHTAGRLAMADCDTLESVQAAFAMGADIVGTTLAGYTSSSSDLSGPDIDLVRHASKLGPVLAEGRYAEPWQVQAAFRAGAVGVVVGGALNDPVKQTRRFLAAAKKHATRVGAVDIGGTWLRFGVVNHELTVVESDRIPLPPTSQERIAWIRQQMERTSVERVGISTGGTVDPRSATVWEAKPIIPDHIGTDFRPLGNIVALNDGLATAWGHACHADFAGKRVATLALGTGVGFGLVDRGRLIMGKRGDYMRLNDVPLPGGATFEDLLGGAALTPNPTADQRRLANEAARAAARLIETLYYPESIVLCGGVGLSDWLEVDLPRSPYGAEAGLIGAASLALFPPEP